MATEHNDHYMEKIMYLCVFIYFTCFSFLENIVNYWLKFRSYLKTQTITKSKSYLETYLKTTELAHGSIEHSIIDVVAFSYVTIWNTQYFIALFFGSLILCNVFQFYGTYIRSQVPILNKFHIALFHSTLQLLPLALSLTYYDTHDVVMNILFTSVSILFVQIMFIESKRINNNYDNNTRINQIYALCIILDYIHIILLLLCELYTTHNYFFYRFIFQSYPFCIGLQIAVIYHEHGYWWRKFTQGSVWSRDLWDGFWFIVIVFFVIPLGGECINASWIILLYNEILSQLRHSRSFDEQLKDSLVEWLNKDKDALLLKICCINHIKLIKNNAHNGNALLIYLEKHHRTNNKFYAKATWSGIRNNSDKLQKMDLLKTIRDKVWVYYRIPQLKSRMTVSWDTFTANRSWRNLRPCLESLWELGAISLLICYGSLSTFNVFSTPWIVFSVMYNRLNMHQTCFLVLYVLVMCIALYKLYGMANYERMMWYIIPDLSTTGCTETDIEEFKTHYDNIKYGFVEIEEILAHAVGNDIAHIVLLYIPDAIHDYKMNEKKI